MKRCLVICLLALFLCLLAGCGAELPETASEPKQVTDYEYSSETPQKGGTLRLALAGASTLNPIMADNDYNLSVLKLLYDSLFQRNEKDVIEPVLCENYTVTPDGLTYEFNIKNGVGFHNGDKLTAADAEATLSLIFSTENCYRSRLSAISSYHSYGQILSITLAYPVVNFPALLDFPVLSDGDLHAFTATTYVPNGTGRYKVQSYKKSKELYLSVNENYFREFAPYIENISVYLLKDAKTAVTMLENFQIDVLTSDVINLNEYTPKRNLSSVEYSSGDFTFLGINNQNPAFLSGKTRTALGAAVNREGIVSSGAVSYATAADLPVPAESFWNNGQTQAVLEPRQIKTMLVEDGWRNIDTSNVPEKEVYGETVLLQPEILVNSENPSRIKIAEQIKSSWNAAGIPAYITVLPFEAYQTRIETMNYDVFVGEVSILENYDLSFLLRTNSNLFGISNENADRLLAQMSISSGDIETQQLFYALCDFMRGETPISGLYFSNDVLVFDDRVRGDIHPSGSDAFYGIEHWFLAK